MKTMCTDAVQIPGYFSHSPTTYGQLWNIVIRLCLTYQQDVMGWSYVPAYLDSLCFLEWRVSWPVQTEQKHEDMALLTIFQLNVYTLWLSFKFMAKILWRYHSEVSWCYYCNPDAKWEQYCVHTLVKLRFFAASSKAASPMEMRRKKKSVFTGLEAGLIIAENRQD